MTTDTPLPERPDQTATPPSNPVLPPLAETIDDVLPPTLVSVPQAEPPVEPATEPMPAILDEAPPSQEDSETDETDETDAEEPEAVPTVVAPETVPEAAPGPIGLDWYVVKVQSGREESIKESIERRVKIDGLQDFFGQIFIPTEKVTEMRGKRRYIRDRKLLPGYFMANIKFDDEHRIQSLFRETSGVGDFVGATGNKKPIPMTENEIKKWIGAGPGELIGPTPSKDVSPYSEGDRVKVKDGMFAGMEGVVKQLLEAKGGVVVELTIFGRPVPVELEYWQVDFA